MWYVPVGLNCTMCGVSFSLARFRNLYCFMYQGGWIEGLLKGYSVVVAGRYVLSFFPFFFFTGRRAERQYVCTYVRTYATYMVAHWRMLVDNRVRRGIVSLMHLVASAVG